MNRHEIMYSLDEIDFVAEQLYNLQNTAQIFTFTGGLGAGKTTLIQAILKRNGIEDSIQSPTFNYVNTYYNNKDETFYHFDLYRLETIQQFFQHGFEEFLYAPSSWAFIEWPEIIKPLLKKNICNCSIQQISSEQRKIIYFIE